MLSSNIDISMHIQERIIAGHSQTVTALCGEKPGKHVRRGQDAALPFQKPAILLCVFLSFVVSPHGARAQEPPTSNPDPGQASPQQPSSAGSLGEQTSAHATPSPDDALDNPVLEQADEERNITYMQSHITFKYNHDEYDGGSSGDLVQVDWLQSFASSNRMAAGIELPLVHFNGSNGEPGGSGLGDIKLQFRGMLGKWEKFEHAAGIEITVPSASNDLVGENETVIRLVWGFSAQVTPHTMLSGELGYNKAVQTSHALTGTNNIEPELILAQAFDKRVGGYLDWDTYYDFHAGEYAQTLKVGIEFELDHMGKWGLSPCFQFPLNHFTRITDIKNTVGVELSYNF